MYIHVQSHTHAGIDTRVHASRETVSLASYSHYTHVQTMHLHSERVADIDTILLASKMVSISASKMVSISNTPYTETLMYDGFNETQTGRDGARKTWWQRRDMSGR